MNLEGDRPSDSLAIHAPKLGFRQKSPPKMAPASGQVHPRGPENNKCRGTQGTRASLLFPGDSASRTAQREWLAACGWLSLTHDRPQRPKEPTLD